jgi:hypothetical protein
VRGREIYKLDRAACGRTVTLSAQPLRNETNHGGAQFVSVTDCCLGCGAKFGETRPTDPTVAAITGRATYQVERGLQMPVGLQSGEKIWDLPCGWMFDYCKGCCWNDRTRCLLCGHVFMPEETIFRRFACHPRRRKPEIWGLCEACAPVRYPVMAETGDSEGKTVDLDSTYHPAKPCEGCGRPVRNRWRKAEWDRGEALPRRTFCSRVCVIRGQVEDRKDQRAALLPKRCIACGDPILRNRRDAKTCSSACRQRSYRERAKAAAS